jgi:hypothetical protein
MRGVGFQPELRKRLWVLGLALFCAGPSFGLEFYVAPTGNDTNPGTRAKPFRTLEQARDHIRNLKRAGEAGPLTIWLRGGDYFRTHTFQLSAQDSGSAGIPITWRAWPGSAR